LFYPPPFLCFGEQVRAISFRINHPFPRSYGYALHPTASPPLPPRPPPFPSLLMEPGNVNPSFSPLTDDKKETPFIDDQASPSSLEGLVFNFPGVSLFFLGASSLCPPPPPRSPQGPHRRFFIPSCQVYLSTSLPSTHSPIPSLCLSGSLRSG